MLSFVQELGVAIELVLREVAEEVVPSVAMEVLRNVSCESLVFFRH